MRSIIFTHGDSDGICAGAIVKSALVGVSFEHRAHKHVYDIT
jgi:single-stranded DNA-specific DHH superfamily exonuclease